MNWFRRETAPPAPVFENVIGPATTLRGDMKGGRGYRIDGQIDGSIESEGPVNVGETGSISGYVRGTDITVDGKVHGDVDATGHLEIGPTGQVIGDIRVKSMRMAAGGVFRGMSRMGEDESVFAVRDATKPPALSSGLAPDGIIASPFGIVPASDSSPLDMRASHEREISRPMGTPERKILRAAGSAEE